MVNPHKEDLEMAPEQVRQGLLAKQQKERCIPREQVALLPDSNSSAEPGPLPPYAQSAINLMLYLLDNHDEYDFNWLDLCAGQAKIIDYFIHNTFWNHKINYFPYELSDDDLCLAIQRGAIFNNVVPYCADASSLDVICNTHRFHFITFNLGLHEIDTNSLSHIIVNCINLLEKDGLFIIYDIEQTTERGAVALSHKQISNLLNAIFQHIGVSQYKSPVEVSQYKPSVSQWDHDRNTRSWSATISRAKVVKDLTSICINDAISAGNTCLLSELRAERSDIIEQTKRYLVDENAAEQDVGQKEFDRLSRRNLAICVALNKLTYG